MIQPGDIFCSCAQDLKSDIILRTTAWNSIDKDARFSHSGFITTKNGDTFESRRRIGCYHINDYIDQPLIIGRNKLMTPEKFGSAYQDIFKEHNGDLYPLWRLLLFTIPPLARRIGTGKFAVCSELTIKMMVKAKVHYNAGWRGWSPDDVADMILRDRDYAIIHLGTATERICHV